MNFILKDIEEEKEKGEIDKKITEDHSKLSRPSSVQYSCPYCSLARNSAKAVLNHVERDHRQEQFSSVKNLWFIRREKGKGKSEGFRI